MVRRRGIPAGAAKANTRDLRADPLLTAPCIVTLDPLDVDRYLLHQNTTTNQPCKRKQAAGEQEASPSSLQQSPTSKKLRRNSGNDPKLNTLEVVTNVDEDNKSYTPCEKYVSVSNNDGRKSPITKCKTSFKNTVDKSVSNTCSVTSGQVLRKRKCVSSSSVGKPKLCKEEINEEESSRDQNDIDTDSDIQTVTTAVLNDSVDIDATIKPTEAKRRSDEETDALQTDKSSLIDVDSEWKFPLKNSLSTLVQTEVSSGSALEQHGEPNDALEADKCPEINTATTESNIEATIKKGQSSSLQTKISPETNVPIKLQNKEINDSLQNCEINLIGSESFPEVKIDSSSGQTLSLQLEMSPEKHVSDEATEEQTKTTSNLLEINESLDINTVDTKSVSETEIQNADSTKELCNNGWTTSMLHDLAEVLDETDALGVGKSISLQVEMSSEMKENITENEHTEKTTLSQGNKSLDCNAESNSDYEIKEGVRGTVENKQNALIKAENSPATDGNNSKDVTADKNHTISSNIEIVLETEAVDIENSFKVGSENKDDTKLKINESSETKEDFQESVPEIEVTDLKLLQTTSREAGVSSIDCVREPEETKIKEQWLLQPEGNTDNKDINTSSPNKSRDIGEKTSSNTNENTTEDVISLAYDIFKNTHDNVIVNNFGACDEIKEDTCLFENEMICENIIQDIEVEEDIKEISLSPEKQQSQDTVPLLQIPTNQRAPVSNAMVGIQASDSKVTANNMPVKPSYVCTICKNAFNSFRFFQCHVKIHYQTDPGLGQFHVSKVMSHCQQVHIAEPNVKVLKLVKRDDDLIKRYHTAVEKKHATNYGQNYLNAISAKGSGTKSTQNVVYSVCSNTTKQSSFVVNQTSTNVEGEVSMINVPLVFKKSATTNPVSVVTQPSAMNTPRTQYILTKIPVSANKGVKVMKNPHAKLTTTPGNVQPTSSLISTVASQMPSKRASHSSQPVLSMFPTKNKTSISNLSRIQMKGQASPVTTSSLTKFSTVSINAASTSNVKNVLKMPIIACSTNQSSSLSTNVQQMPIPPLTLIKQRVTPPSLRLTKQTPQMPQTTTHALTTANIHRGGKALLLRCPLCKLVFASEDKFKAHVDTHKKQLPNQAGAVLTVQRSAKKCDQVTANAPASVDRKKLANILKSHKLSIIGVSKERKQMTGDQIDKLLDKIMVKKDNNTKTVDTTISEDNIDEFLVKMEDATSNKCTIIAENTMTNEMTAKHKQTTAVLNETVSKNESGGKVDGLVMKNKEADQMQVSNADETITSEINCNQSATHINIKKKSTKESALKVSGNASPLSKHLMASKKSKQATTEIFECKICRRKHKKMQRLCLHLMKEHRNYVNDFSMKCSSCKTIFLHKINNSITKENYKYICISVNDILCDSCILTKRANTLTSQMDECSNDDSDSLLEYFDGNEANISSYHNIEEVTLTKMINLMNELENELEVESQLHCLQKESMKSNDIPADIVLTLNEDQCNECGQVVSYNDENFFVSVDTGSPESDATATYDMETIDLSLMDDASDDDDSTSDEEFTSSDDNDELEKIDLTQEPEDVHEYATENTNMFKCETCSDSFNSHNDLLSHVNDAPTSLNIPCIYCDKFYINKEQFEHHIRFEHFVCKYCDEYVGGELGMLRHDKEHDNGEIHFYLCKCNQEYAGFGNFDSHVSREHGNSVNYYLKNFQRNNWLKRRCTSYCELKRQCHYCDNVFESTTLLNEHLKSWHKLVQCSLCNTMLREKVDSQNVIPTLCAACEVLQTNPVDNNDENEDCEIVDEFLVEDSPTKKNVVNLSPNVTESDQQLVCVIYMCEECNQKFKSESLLKLHFQGHPDHKPVCKYKCSSCHSDFRNECSLILHEKYVHATSCRLKAPDVIVHRGDSQSRIYRCEFCSALFPDSNSFLAHNSGYKCFSKLVNYCSYCIIHFDTGLEFNQHYFDFHHHRNDLYVKNYFDYQMIYCRRCQLDLYESVYFGDHFKNCLENQKLFYCTFCDKVFINRACLLKHEYVHVIRNVSIKCSLCLNHYFTLDNLNMHLLDVHTTKVLLN